MGTRGTKQVKRQYAGGATELLKVLYEEHNNLSGYLFRDGVVSGSCGLAAEVGTIQNLATVRPVTIRIDGEEIVVPPVASFVPAAVTIADNKWGAFLISAGVDGVASMITSEIGALVMTADTELEAILSLLAESDTNLISGDVVIGICTLQGDSTGWTGATDDFAIADALTQAINFYDIYASGNAIITAATAFAQSATTDEMDISAVVAKMNGRRITLAADTDFPFSQADTINTAGAASAMWGGWLIVQDMAGVIHTLSATNEPITADNQTYAQKADASAALDAIEALIDLIPILIVVGRLFVQCKLSDTFTANTELLNVSDAAVDAIDFDITASEDLDYDLEATGGTARTKPPPSLVTI